MRERTMAPRPSKNNAFSGRALFIAMHYALRIKKFLYSQYFYCGLRIACGISLPAALMLTVFHGRALGFAIAAGALGACQVDMRGPLKHKRNDMLACTLIGSLAALANGLAAYRPLTLMLTVAT